MVAALFTLYAQTRSAFSGVTCFIQMLMCCSCLCLLPLVQNTTHNHHITRQKHQSRYHTLFLSFRGRREKMVSFGESGSIQLVMPIMHHYSLPSKDTFLKKKKKLIFFFSGQWYIKNTKSHSKAFTRYKLQCYKCFYYQLNLFLIKESWNKLIAYK